MKLDHLESLALEDPLVLVEHLEHLEHLDHREIGDKMEVLE